MSRASHGRFVDSPSSLIEVAGSAGNAPFVVVERACSKVAEVCVVGGLGFPSAVFCVFVGGVDIPLVVPSPAEGDAIIGVRGVRSHQRTNVGVEGGCNM